MSVCRTQTAMRYGQVRLNLRSLFEFGNGLRDFTLI